MARNLYARRGNPARHHPDMKTFLRTLFLLCVISGAGYLFSEARRHPDKPVGAVIPQSKARAVLPQQTVKLKGIKAVMLGGEVDGVNGQTTVSYTNYLKRVAGVLRARGVEVKEFYSPTSMETLKQAVRGAHILVYAGHGIGDAQPPSYEAKMWPGGMLVLEQVWVQENDIQKFEPAKGAIIIYIGACFTAGNSGGDMGKIGETEARRRVSVYSKPLMAGNKFAGYYATWSDTTAQEIVANAFAGKTLGQSYDPSGKFDNVARLRHPDFPDRDMWVHKNRYAEGTVFDYAFVGNSEKTIEQLWGNTGGSDANDNRPNVDPARPNPEKDKALIRAIYAGKADDAEAALSGGANPDAVSKGWTALLLSVYYDRRDIVSLLIAKKANMNAEVEGYNALALAEAYDRTEISAMLKKAGAVKSRAVPAKKPTAPK